MHIELAMLGTLQRPLLLDMLLMWMEMLHRPLLLLLGRMRRTLSVRLQTGYP